MKKLKLLFNLSVLCVCVESFVLFSIQFLNLIKDDNVKKTISYIIAVCFWLFILIEMILLFAVCRQRRKICDISNRFPVGIISFFKTGAGKFFDILSVVFIVTMIVIISTKASSRWLIISSLSIFFLSLQLRCFYNGRNYRELKGEKNK